MTSILTSLKQPVELLHIVKVNPFFWFVIFASILTGQFLEIISLFAIVIIHELGHVFTAKSYGWKIEEIQLLPFGGMAKVEQASDSLWEELVVAISGPLQNFMMIGVAFSFQKINLWSEDWTAFFVKANMMIGLFNLLPISPLDGNKIIKAFFYFTFPFKRALKITAFISIVLTIVFLLWSVGFFTLSINLNGIILSFFFIYNNINDLRYNPYQFWRFLLLKSKSSPLSKVVTKQIVIDKNITLMDALSLLFKGKYHIFYLIDDFGNFVKMLPEEKLIHAALQNQEVNQPISKFFY